SEGELRRRVRTEGDGRAAVRVLPRPPLGVRLLALLEGLQPHPGIGERLEELVRALDVVRLALVIQEPDGARDARRLEATGTQALLELGPLEEGPNLTGLGVEDAKGHPRGLMTGGRGAEGA